MGTLGAHLVPTDRLFASLPELRFSAEQTQRYCNGVKLPLEQVAGVVPEHTEYRVYGADGGFLGIAQAEPETGLLRVGKNFS